MMEVYRFVEDIEAGGYRFLKGDIIAGEQVGENVECCFIHKKPVIVPVNALEPGGLPAAAEVIVTGRASHRTANVALLQLLTEAYLFINKKHKNMDKWPRGMSAYFQHAMLHDLNEGKAS